MTYTNAELAQIVQKKNASLYDGHGIQVLRHVILYLERDDRESAQHCCMTDHDKIRELDGWLRDLGLFSDDYVARLTRANWKWR